MILKHTTSTRSLRKEVIKVLLRDLLNDGRSVKLHVRVSFLPCGVMYVVLSLKTSITLHGACR